MQLGSKKSPAIALLYWATVLAACSIGETVADLFSHELALGYVKSSAIFLTLFFALLLLERRIKVQREARYWTAIVIMSTTGTTLADMFTRTLKLGYTGTSALLIALFAGVLIVWRRVRPPAAGAPAADGTPAADGAVLPHVRIETEHSAMPDTDGRYWAAIMIASTLGTSLGDWVSNVLGTGFGGGTAILSSLLAADLVWDHFAGRTSEIRYWAALVITSTIGATSGDYLTKEEGLHFPFSWVIAAQIAVFVALVIAGHGRTPVSAAGRAVAPAPAAERGA